MFRYYLSKLIKKLHIPAIKECKIDKTSKVCSGSHLVNVTMARYSYIGNFCTVLNTNIGAFCSIADNVIIGGASHPLDWVSTSPVFHSGKNVMIKNFYGHSFENTYITNIGNDVWIGNNCLIKAGIKVGNGAVIGMGSVVTKDVGPYEIWGGNPAKLIRKRLSEEKIYELLNTKWWNYDDKKLENLALYFSNVESFINRTKSEGRNEDITLG